MKDTSKAIIATMSLIIIFLVLAMNAKPYHSNSGSMKILRTNGTINKANNTLYYYSNNNLSTNELKAIVKLRNVTNIKILK